MKMLRNKNAPPTADLVQKYIDSAYDTVKLVADNLAVVLEVSQALAAGTFDDIVYTYDINTFAELNALVADEELATEAYVQAAVVGLYDHKGGYDPDSNVPDLTTDPSSIQKADAYTINAAGVFYGSNVDPGDVIIANQDNPTAGNHWTIVNRNIDESAFASAAQGALADTALQPGGVDNISELINDLNFADDQTPAEIAAAYDTAVALASQAEAESGLETATRRWSPLRVAQAARAQAGAVTFVTDDYIAASGQVLFVDTRIKAIQITLPAGADKDTIWIFDGGHNASVNNITIVPDGGGTDTIDTDPNFILDMNESFVRIAYRAANTDWYVGISSNPDLVEMASHTHVVANITDFPDLSVYALITGFPEINDQTGTSYQFTAADLEDGVVANNAGASAYSIPDGLGTPGDTLNLYNKGAGTVTIDMAGTDTLHSVDNKCEQYKAVTMLKIGTTEWTVIGGTA